MSKKCRFNTEQSTHEFGTTIDTSCSSTLLHTVNSLYFDPPSEMRKIWLRVVIGREFGFEEAQFIDRSSGTCVVLLKVSGDIENANYSNSDVA